jgi:nucleoside-diphosphate-sugar epimerase
VNALSLATYDGICVAVLGATGFIGGWIARSAAGHGARVLLIARDAQRVETMARTLPGAGAAALDAGDDTALRTVLDATRPAVVFNAIGYGVDRNERDDDVAQRINTRFPGMLADAVASTRDRAWRGAALVHLGSALEYGRAAGDLQEDTEPRPDTLYGRTKLEGTRALAARSRVLDLASVTARLFTVYGAGEHEGRLLPALLACARDGTPVDLTAGEQLRDFTYAGDIAEGVLRLGLARVAPGEVVNLATGRLTSVRTFAESAARVLDLAPAQLRFGALPARAEEMQHEPVSIERLRRHTGWTPETDIATGIRRTQELMGASWRG